MAAPAQQKPGELLSCPPQHPHRHRSFRYRRDYLVLVNIKPDIRDTIPPRPSPYA
jgi:hypothetical protein